LYTQALAPNVSKILKLKEIVPSLLAKKIKDIYRTINDFGKVRPKINMITKRSLIKQIIVPMNNDNKAKFITSLSTQVTNISSTLRNIKSDMIANFVRTDQHGIIIMMNKVASLSDFQTIENYVKNIDHLDSEDMKVLHLFQSKFYPNIIGIPYLIENTNISINASMIKSILKNNHIFNNISLTSKP